ncbi:MAG TPA: hypothetical protein VHI95_14190 [Acidimicrobiales bacterium]|nr:hypothetical protein [Acidimicrobiales bacterium]
MRVLDRLGPRRATILGVVVVACIAVIPIGWNAVMAAREGWVPEGDGAIITLRTHDVLTSNPPLLGNPTTAGRSQPGDVYHPGPLGFFLLAAPLRLFGASAHGMLFGSALVNIASLLGLLWFAYRRGGAPLCLVAGLWAVILVWALGNEIPHDSYNPHIVLLPMAFLLMLTWSVVCGDLLALPFAVAAGSLAAQSHAYEVIYVAVMAAWIICALALRFPRGRSEPPAGNRRRWIAGSLILGFFLWLPPIIDQILHDPGNLRQLADFARDGGTPVQGISFAVQRAADYLVPPFRWTNRTPGFYDLVHRPGGLRVALLGLLLAGAVVLAVTAWRRGLRDSALLIVTALVAIGGSVLAAARLPQGFATLSPYNHRHWWITATFFWFAIGWTIVDLLRARVPANGRLALGAAVIALSVGFAFVAMRNVTIVDDRGSVSFGALEYLTPAAADAVRARAGGSQPVAVSSLGPEAFASVEPGIVSGLVLRGIDARVDRAEAKVFGSAHSAEDAPTRLVIRSGDDYDQAPQGMDLVATYDPNVDVREKGYRNSGIAGGVSPLAVYIGS